MTMLVNVLSDRLAADPAVMACMVIEGFRNCKSPLLSCTSGQRHVKESALSEIMNSLSVVDSG